MSTAKRTRQRQADAGAATALPPAKRTKTSNGHDDQPSSLAFLTDETKRSQKNLEAKLTNGLTKPRINKVDDSSTRIRSTVEDESGDEDLDGDNDGSDSDMSSSSEDPSSESEDESEDNYADVIKTNGVSHHNADDGDLDERMAGVDEEQSEGPAEAATVDPINKSKIVSSIQQDGAVEGDAVPSFGELLQQAHPEIIKVASAFDGPDSSRALTLPESRSLNAPSGNSLGTVLSQALRTNDKELLESCLQTTDIDSIKSTIQRLQSSLVVPLLQRLAERLHKRPGRAGPLLVWIQWSLVTHGSYLAGHPELVKRLRSLRQVVKERTNSLHHLITLKGKLDMLSAQVEIRRSLRSQQAKAGDSEDEEVDVVYVDGQDDDFSSSSEDEKPAPRSRSLKTSRGSDAALAEAAVINVEDDIPLINGIDDNVEVESLPDSEDLESDEEVNGGLIDDKAEESANDESVSSEEEESEDDADSEDDAQDLLGSSSSEEEPARRSARPAKRNALIRKR